MNHIEKLEKYLIGNLIKHEIFDDVLILGKEDEEKEYFIVDDSRMIIDEDMDFLPIVNMEIDGFVYEFGGRYYLQDSDESKLQMNELMYNERAVQAFPVNSFLGIRSSYELMNGLSLYKDWVRKAKFLGTKTLGICERHTLAGVIVFQNECQRNGIKSVIGMTISIQGKENFDIKCYAQDFQGWQNLLKFNSKINVEGNNSITLEFLKENRLGLYIVADPKSMDHRELEDFEFKNIINFYQLDTVNFLNEEKDKWYIENLEKFMKSDLEPILITDAFYLEQRDFEFREALWTVNKAFDDATDNQYFKNKDQYIKELAGMFEDGNDSWKGLFKKALANEELLSSGCNFEYDTNTRHLPKYTMTDEESQEFDTNEQLFLNLVSVGFKKKNLKDPQKYLKRLKAEIEVLKMGDVIDYFLILHDIVRYATDQEMLTGIGRGSAGGSLVAYLLGIIHVDPLEFDLLFERFLNSGRMGKFEDRPSYIFEDENGNQMELAEGELAKVNRDGNILNVYCHEIKEGDEIIKY
tara:strand:+ start:4277 stop:5845 length:1569 start_codon:yes stop_codon:yes gene_type:complete